MRTTGSSIIIAAILSTVARATEFQVTVGGPGVLRFNPEYVNATSGDTVVFSFRQENHTVTQSSLDSPCQIADGGFDSNFVPVAANNTDGPFPAAQYTVTDGSPVWIFCRQANHCQQGMVFAINPGDNFTMFKANLFGNSTANSSMPATISSTSTATASTTDPVSSSTLVSSSIVTTAPGSASAHIVVVGADGKLAYEPSNITAAVGDVVTFLFMHANHTATQSSFSDPCKSLTKTSTSGQVGFDSGFMPVANGTSNYPTFTVEVNNTDPVWVYCKQTNPQDHCAAGMVFSMNAVACGLEDYSAFVDAAKQSNATSGTSHSGGSRSTTSNRNAGVAFTLFALMIGLAL
ncbi:uncharacterized protein B0H18DRAFT_876449 [Fomitopsis serialis]|uniref:uncharacterized protein n=1 Tax=Fomitopsis serialis TaxID=139415 RepID=UPI0020078210|nr:uncharacterized protein B0H18DRAFT_876449 [Neoantrodia serialis]KAH9926130.1 hypothetical protein B0H18DRAFT_876449 [Neoantrodia serialis]